VFKRNVIIRIIHISASFPPRHTGGPKFSPVATGDLYGLISPNKVSTLKLKCETLEISAVFINPYSVLSFNL